MDMLSGLLGSMGIDVEEITQQVSEYARIAKAKLDSIDARLSRIEAALKIEGEANEIGLE